MPLSNLNLLAKAPNGVARLRELILTLAVQGKLVSQDPKDEPASELLKKIRAEKDRLIAEGKIKRDKPLAEIAEEETPCGLPKGWKWVRNETLLSLRKGKNPKTLSDQPIGKPYLDIEALDRHQIRRYSNEAQVVLCSAKDILVVCDGSRSGLVLQGKDGIVGSTLAVIETPQFIQPYIRLIFRAGFQRFNSGMKGAAIPHLDTKTVLGEVTGLPPEAEQSRIVTRVEELMRLCDALEARGQIEAAQHAQLVSTLLGTLTDSETPAQLTENWHRIATHFDLLLDRPEAVDAMEQTILQLAVRGLLSTHAAADAHVEIGDRENSPVEIPPSWSHVSFGDVLLELRYGTSVKCGYEVIGTPVLRIPNLKSGRVDTTDLKFGVLDEREKEKLRLELGDLLIIRSNGSVSLVGSAALVSAESEGFAFAGYLVRARFKREYVEPTYLVLVMQTLEIRAQIEAPIRTTSGVKNINSTEIYRLAFALPPLAEQSRIVTCVAQLRRLCADLRQRLSASQSTQAHLAEALVQEVA